MNASDVLGFAAWTAITCAAAVPLTNYLREKKRAPLVSRRTKFHVWLGFSAAVLAGSHAVFALRAIGVELDDLTLVSAAAAFFVLVVHAGFGQQLRNPALKNRIKLRRSHLVTAIALGVTVTLHAVRALLAK